MCVAHAPHLVVQLSLKSCVAHACVRPSRPFSAQPVSPLLGPVRHHLGRCPCDWENFGGMLVVGHTLAAGKAVYSSYPRCLFSVSWFLLRFPSVSIMFCLSVSFLSATAAIRPQSASGLAALSAVFSKDKRHCERFCGISVFLRLISAITTDRKPTTSRGCASSTAARSSFPRKSCGLEASASDGYLARHSRETASVIVMIRFWQRARRRHLAVDHAAGTTCPRTGFTRSHCSANGSDKQETTRGLRGTWSRY